MNVETIRGVFLWSGIINYALLVVWALCTLSFRTFYHRFARWFGVSTEVFDGINYGAMALYKIAIILFNFAPYIAMRIVA